MILVRISKIFLHLVLKEKRLEIIMIDVLDKKDAFLGDKKFFHFLNF